MATTLIPALQAVNSPANFKAGQADKALLKHVLGLLQNASEKCAERKEQITPLVNALIPAKDTTDTA